MDSINIVQTAVNDTTPDVEIVQPFVVNYKSDRDLYQAITEQNIYIQSLHAGIFRLVYNGERRIYYKNSNYITISHNKPVLLFCSDYFENNKTYRSWFLFDVIVDEQSFQYKITFGRTDVNDGSIGNYNVFITKNNVLTADDIIDSLYSTATDKVLSAKQGRVLKELIDTINSKIPASASATNKLVDTETFNNSLAGKQNTLTFDNEPTEGSDNPVKSGGVYTAIQEVIEDEGTKEWALETFAPISLVSTVNGINSKIPAQASSENQLADKSYVETLVAQNGSHFLGTFENVQALRTGTASTATNNDYANVTNSIWRFQDNAGLNGYPKDRLTNNDYAVVNQAAATGPIYDYNYYQFNIETQTWTWIAGQNIDDYDKYATYYNRYTYNADTSSWVWNFTVNNMSLSAAQIDALNSGITSAKVTEYDRKPQNYILAENENAFFNSNDEYIEVPLATALVLRYPVVFNKTAADLKVGDILTRSMSGNYPSRIVAAKNSTKVTLAYLDRGLNSTLGFTITEVTI